MNSRRVRLADIAELTVGYVGNMAKQYTDKGVKFLRSLNIKPFHIVEDDMKYISKEFCASLRKSILHENDLIIVRTGLPGTCCVVPKEYDGCNCADVVLVKPNVDIVNPHYLAAYINMWGKKQVENNKVGAIQKHFNVKSAEEMLIDLPDIEYQNKIAKVLRDINDKILNNEKINDYLEEMAKTIYDYWFVQFDFPNENGEPYKSSGGEMMYSPKLDMEIPAFWEIKTLRGHHNIERGISYTSKDISSGKGTPMINLACIDINRNYRDGQLKYYANDVSADKQLTGNELLIACTDLTRNADIVGSPILVPKIAQQMTFSMDMAKLEVDNCIFDKYYLYMTLRTKYYHNFIKKYASGTNVLHLNLDGLNWYTMWVPPLPLQSQFGHIIHKLQVYMNDILHENRQLYDLRDWLLPMLMNGQATIED